MKQGYIVYSLLDVDKNIWFIEKMTSFFKSHDINLSLLIEESISSPIKADFVIYRGRDYTFIEHLEENGVRVFNNSKVNGIANDKYLSYEMFRNLRIEAVKTYTGYEGFDFPFIMKSVSGHGGNEVYLIEEISKLVDILSLNKDKHYVYQQYMSNCVSDIRVYTLGNEIIGVVKRSNHDDFRHNYSLGGEVSLLEDIPEYVKESVKKITTYLKSDYLGIDFLYDGEKYYANEIEDPVGARMLYKVSDIDILTLFGEYILKELSLK